MGARCAALVSMRCRKSAAALCTAQLRRVPAQRPAARSSARDSRPDRNAVAGAGDSTVIHTKNMITPLEHGRRDIDVVTGT